MKTLEELQTYAWQLMAKSSPAIRPPNKEGAIYRYWLEHKDGLGPPMTNEYALTDGENLAGQVFCTGKVLVWRGGDEVIVV